MNADDALRCVGRLVGGAPGPWDEPSVQTYTDEFMSWTGPHAAEVLTTVVAELVATWDIPFRPMISEIHDRWSRAMAVRTPVLPPTSAVHCDGSGWTWTEHGLVPCPRCNGAAAAVYADGSKLNRWRTGTDLEDLEVGVERVKGVLRYIDRREPVLCAEWEEDPVEPAVGRRAAWNGYQEQCEDDGRQPNPSHFLIWQTS